MSPYHYPSKVTQVDGNNGDSCDRCIRKVRPRLFVFGKGQKSQKVSFTVCETEIFAVSLCVCTYSLSYL